MNLFNLLKYKLAKSALIKTYIKESKSILDYVDCSIRIINKYFTYYDYWIESTQMPRIDEEEFNYRYEHVKTAYKQLSDLIEIQYKVCKDNMQVFAYLNRHNISKFHEDEELWGNNFNKLSAYKIVLSSSYKTKEMLLKNRKEKMIYLKKEKLLKDFR